MITQNLTTLEALYSTSTTRELAGLYTSTDTNNTTTSTNFYNTPMSDTVFASQDLSALRDLQESLRKDAADAGPTPQKIRRPGQPLSEAEAEAMVRGAVRISCGEAPVGSAIARSIPSSGMLVTLAGLERAYLRGRLKAEPVSLLGYALRRRGRTSRVVGPVTGREEALLSKGVYSMWSEFYPFTVLETQGGIRTEMGVISRSDLVYLMPPGCPSVGPWYSHAHSMRFGTNLAPGPAHPAVVRRAFPRLFGQSEAEVWRLDPSNFMIGPALAKQLPPAAAVDMANLPTTEAGWVELMVSARALTPPKVPFVTPNPEALVKIRRLQRCYGPAPAMAVPSPPVSRTPEGYVYTTVEVVEVSTVRRIITWEVDVKVPLSVALDSDPESLQDYIEREAQENYYNGTETNEDIEHIDTDEVNINDFDLDSVYDLLEGEFPDDAQALEDARNSF